MKVPVSFVHYVTELLNGKEQANYAVAVEVFRVGPSSVIKCCWSLPPGDIECLSAVATKKGKQYNKQRA